MYSLFIHTVFIYYPLCFFFFKEQNLDGFINPDETTNNSVLEQLANDNKTQCPYQPPNALRRRANLPWQGWKVGPILEEGHLRIIENLDEEKDTLFWTKPFLDSQMAAFTCKHAQMADGDGSPTLSVSSMDSFSSVTTELRSSSALSNPFKVPVALPLEKTTFHTAIRKKKPATPSNSHISSTQSEKRKSRLPVFSAKVGGARKHFLIGLIVRFTCWMVDIV